MDQQELTAWCQREHPRLVGMLALHTGDVPVAEELAQEALVQLFQSLAAGRVPDQPGAWLRRVALNLAASWFRRRAAERRARRRVAGGVQEHRDVDTAEVLAVRAAVASLPIRQRTVVVLRFYEQWSVAETAELMGVAPGTVKSLTSHAVTALRATGLAHAEVEELTHG